MFTLCDGIVQNVENFTGLHLLTGWTWLNNCPVRKGGGASLRESAWGHKEGRDILRGLLFGIF